MEITEPAAASSTAPASEGESVEPTRVDRVLVVVFWVWAGLLAVATLAQLLGWEQVLDSLDVKRWF